MIYKLFCIVKHTIRIYILLINIKIFYRKQITKRKYITLFYILKHINYILYILLINIKIFY